MSRRGGDPNIRVLDYFKQAPLAEAQQTLATARWLMRDREQAEPVAGVPVKAVTKPRRRRTKKANTAEAGPAATSTASLRPARGRAAEPAED